MNFKVVEFAILQTKFEFSGSRFLPGQMTRIQEPDLLIDHDSGGGVCHRFLGSPVEPFTYSGVNQMKLAGQAQKISGCSSGKWFPFSPIASHKAPTSRTKKEADAVAFSSSLSSTPAEEKPIIVVHNNNNNIVLDITDDNTRWSPATSNHSPSCKSTSAILAPVLPSSNNKTKSRHSSNNKNCSNNSDKLKHSNKNTNSSNNHKNNCTSNSNTSNNSNPINKSSTNSRINNCGPSSIAATASSHINPVTNHHTGGGSSSDDDESGTRHLIVRYIHCNERPSKKQLVTLGLISLVFLLILVILLALFLSPSSTRTLSSSYTSSSVSSSDDAFMSSDITSSLNSDDVELDDSDSYDDNDSSYYPSSTRSSSSVGLGSNVNTGIDMKKVSKMSWDLLNSNQDASSRGSGGSRGGGLSPLGGGNGNGGEGEIILPAKMIYTSSGDSTDLIPSENGGGGGGSSQNKKRSCCRTQKYSQVIKKEGCEPLTIVNKMCFGQCVSVWVPGLFASFPVCRPSKSTFKMVTLTCGRNGEKRKRVRIEKVRRCSCMEIEPTAASL